MWVLVNDGEIVGIATSPPSAQAEEWVELPDTDPLWHGYRLKRARQEKIGELDTACGQSIVAGFWSTALGSPHFYSSQLEDQINLIGATQLDIPLPYVCTPHGGVKQPILHTVDQLKQVFADGGAKKAAYIQHFHSLRLQLESATTLEAIAAIEWGEPE